jgi:hypothetical protein
MMRKPPLSLPAGRGRGWKFPLAVALIGAAVLALLAVAIVGSFLIGFHPDALSKGRVQERAPNERFALLRDRHSNECGLQPAALATLPASGRLQGACCSPMNLAHYKQQLSGLKTYRTVPLVPADPYDVSVRLAVRLSAYDHSIQLTRLERRQYDQAVRLSKEHGPCCCQCWRWSAFEGQAKRFIVEHRYSAAEIAAIWGLEDGCGGRA